MIAGVARYLRTLLPAMVKPRGEVAVRDTLIIKSCPLVKVFLGVETGSFGESPARV